MIRTVSGFEFLKYVEYVIYDVHYIKNDVAYSAIDRQSKNKTFQHHGYCVDCRSNTSCSRLTRVEPARTR